MKRQVDAPDGSSAHAALEYAQRGWSVLPIFSVGEDGLCTCGSDQCAAPGKHPLVASGFKAATTDLEVIRGWWEKYPNANVAIATGSCSDLVVLDIDPRHGGDESVRHLGDNFDIPPAAEARTGGGGTHLYFRHPGGWVPCKVGILPGIDIRGDGGYVVAPPSRHVSGGIYYWKRTPYDVKLLPAPAWLIEGLHDHGKPYREPNFENLIPEGRRNSTLAGMAGTLRNKGLMRSEILATLCEVNKRCDPPLEMDELSKIATSFAGYDAPSRIRPTASLPLKERPFEVKLVEVRAEVLAQSATVESALSFLPLLGTPGYCVSGWSHLIAGYPRVGKTDLVFSLVREWLRSGLGVVYVTEEALGLWRHRLLASGDNCVGLVLVQGLGANPTELYQRVFSGSEEIVVVDTMRNLLQPDDETDNSAIAKVLNPWIAQAREAKKTLLMVHHMRKGSGEHGEGIAGGHSLLGTFDIALEIRRDSRNSNRRAISTHARIISPPDLVYERSADGSLRSLGQADAVARDELMTRVKDVLGTEPQTRKNILDGLGDPAPSDEQLRLVLNALAEAGDIERQPPLSQGSKPGITYRWSLLTPPPTTLPNVGG